MKQRVITGVLGAAGFLYLLWLGREWYSGLLFIIATAAYFEFCRMKDLHWSKIQVIIGAIFVWLLLISVSGLSKQLSLASYPIFQDTKLINLGMVIFFILIVLTKNHFDLNQMTYIFIGILYIGYGFAHMIHTIWRVDGVALTLLIILVTWATDSGALLFGKRFGRKKLWPAISPNKTVEGALGGLFLGVLMSGIVILFIFPELGSLSQALFIGVMISLFGQMGDLIESAWKRSIGVKDSGTILPGHGGFLDRFDSLLFTFIMMRLLDIV